MIPNCTQHQQCLEAISVYLRNRKTVSAVDTYNFQFTHLCPCHPAYHLTGAKAVARGVAKGEATGAKASP